MHQPLPQLENRHDVVLVDRLYKLEEAAELPVTNTTN